DTFDLPSFFQLHDLNRDGVWDTEEVEAVYGVHHVYSQKKSKDDEAHAAKAKVIVETVMKLLDKDRDGKVTAEELAVVGLEGLPSFDDLGAEGHHYDVESEFFLHHEEQFHNTPETQTDESYNHPEDIEHFGSHERIEREEAEREAKFQGISVEEALAQHEPHADEPHGDEPHADQVQDAPAAQKTYTRAVPPEKQDPVERFREAKAESEKFGDWGEGDAGYRPPNTAGEKMRKNLPYKYKFRRSWGDF
ncbi:hypothetical protein OF83DRAFT_1047979, partial [Amylostereum chailletii]